MLTKNQVLPIGSLIRVHFKSDEGKGTIAVIIGHLTLRRDMISRYDYTCVEYPCGVEDGLLYVNHEDIVEVIHKTNDDEKLHENWMRMKYAEYLAYYKHYDQQSRPDIDTMRQRIIQERKSIHNGRCRLAYYLAFSSLIFIGAVLTAVLSATWIAGIVAIIFAGIGFLMRK